MDINETVKSFIKKSDLPAEKKDELLDKLAKAHQAEREMADKEAFKSWAKGERNQLDVTTARSSEYTKNANGERKTRLRSPENNYTNGFEKVKPEWKQVSDSKKRHDKKVDKNESLQEQILSLKEAFDALFEVSGTEEDEKKQNVNKIKREKKVGPGKEPTEIVSVADELFPYEGSAKEQFNQKVIAKINDMIEGKATLEDLIQLVRQKKTPVREGLEGAEDMISIMEEMINEISKERADETTYKRDQRCKDLKSEYQRTRDSKVGLKYEEALVKDWKNSKLRDKWDILKGIKRGKDGEFHDIKDYKEYKEKHES